MSLPSPFPFLFPLPKLRDLRRRRRPRICPLFPLPSNLRLPSPSFSSIKKYALNWTSRAKERRVRESQSLRGFLQIQIALEPPFLQRGTSSWMVIIHPIRMLHSRMQKRISLPSSSLWNGTKTMGMGMLTWPPKRRRFRFVFGGANNSRFPRVMTSFDEARRL